METLKDTLIFVKSNDLLIEAEKKWFDQKVTFLFEIIKQTNNFFKFK